MSSTNPKNLPRWRSMDELVDYFETHDMGEHFDQMPETHFEVEIKSRKHLIVIDEEVFSTLAEIAQKEGVSTDELIDTWLKERIVQAKR